MSNIPERWIEKAQYDLGSAKAMLDAQRHIHVLFFCQQAVEKLLKAIIAKKSGQSPPRIHNLPRLAEIAKVPLDASHAELLRELSSMYIDSRYPFEEAEIGENIAYNATKEIHDRTVEVGKWLLSLL